VRVKCLAYEHNAMSPARSRTRTARSGVERTNHEATAPHTPSGKQNGNLRKIEMGEAFDFKTPSSILIVDPSCCGNTCFTESLLLDHLDELFVNPPTAIHYCCGAWQDGF